MQPFSFSLFGVIPFIYISLTFIERFVLQKLVTFGS